MKVRRRLVRLFFATALLSALLAGELKAGAFDANAVSEIHARGLEAFQGRRLVVFCISGREGLITGQGQRLHVAALKSAPLSTVIAADGSAIVPKTFVPISDFRAFNYLVFAVSSENDRGYESIRYLSLLEFKMLELSQGDDGTVTLDLSPDSGLPRAL